MREIPPKIWEEVILDESYNSYFLPEDLQPGTTAKVLAHDYGALMIEQNGKTWRISDRCIKHEFLFQVGDRWYRANHLAVAREKERDDAIRRAFENQPDITQLMK
jgi:hypothetical protein